MSPTIKTFIITIAVGALFFLYRIITYYNTPQKARRSRSNIKLTGNMIKCYGSGHKLVIALTVVFFMVLVCIMLCFMATQSKTHETIEASVFMTLVSFIGIGLGLAILLLKHYKCDYIAYNNEGFIVKAWRDKTFSRTGEKQTFLWRELRDLSFDNKELTLVFTDGKSMKVYNLVNCQPFIDMAQNHIV